MAVIITSCQTFFTCNEHRDNLPFGKWMKNIETTVLGDLEVLEANGDTFCGLAGRSIEDLNE